MLGSNITLPRSRDHNGMTRDCSRCGANRPESDGVSLGSKWVCGKCWRTKATRPQGALQALSQEKRIRK